jgi:hypothetical protein
MFILHRGELRGRHIGRFDNKTRRLQVPHPLGTAPSCGGFVDRNSLSCRHRWLINKGHDGNYRQDGNSQSQPLTQSFT